MRKMRYRETVLPKVTLAVSGRAEATQSGGHWVFVPDDRGKQCCHHRRTEQVWGREGIC